MCLLFKYSEFLWAFLLAPWDPCEPQWELQGKVSEKIKLLKKDRNWRDLCRLEDLFKRENVKLGEYM